MASREETLLFIVDVQVRNAKALAELDAGLDAALRAREARFAAAAAAASAAGSDVGGTRGVVIPGESTGNGNRYVAVAGGGQQRSGFPDIVGIRGRQNIGGRQNPMVFAEESGAASGLGGLAAASAAQGADRGSTPPVAAAMPTPSPEPVNRTWLEAAAQAVAEKAIAPEDTRVANALAAAAASQRRTGSTGALGGMTLAEALSAARQPEVTAFATALAAARPRQQQTTPPSSGSSGLLAAAVASRLGIPLHAVYGGIHSGLFPGAFQAPGYAPAWGNTTRWTIPENELAQAIAQAGGEKALADALMAGAPAGGGGGGRGVVPPVAVGGGGDRGGSNFWQRLLWGTGAFGLAGFGTLGSFAGLGPEHLAMTGIGLAGSAATGLAGAGLLGLGSLGELAVGAGSDLGVSVSAIADTKTLAGDYQNLANAVADYGKKSAAAGLAQAQLNRDMTQLGATAGVRAEAQLAQQIVALNTAWDAQTSQARVEFVQIADQAVKLAQTYMPLVIQAAETNLAIINQDIKPLFAWLEGPHGIGIWENLENNFAHQLPTAIAAFTQGIELVLRVTSLASNYTGGLMTSLDKLFTRLNSYSDQQLNSVIGRLVDDFRVWEQFVKALITDIALLFRQDAGTGQSIIQTLTTMLQKLGDWERSTSGASQLHNIFEVHKQEVQQLLQLLPPLISGFGSIYMTVAPPVTEAMTSVLSVVVKVLDAIVALGPASRFLLGLALLAGKFGLLGTGLRAAAVALGLMTAQTSETEALTNAVNANTAALTGQADAAAAAADSMDALAGAQGRVLSTAGDTAAASDTSLFANLQGTATGALSEAMPLLAAGGAGVLGGSILQSALGLQGGAGGTIGGGITGALIGSLGGPLGTALGGAIGATLGPSILHLLGSVFGSGPAENYGKQFASAWIQPFQGIVTTKVGQSMQKIVADATNQLDKVTAPPRPEVGRFGVPSLPVATPAGPSQQTVLQAQYKYGQEVAQQFERGLNSVPYSSTGGLILAFTKQIESLPPKAGAEGQAAAAQMMLEYAQTLAQEGRLPQDAVSKIIASLEAEFPAMAKYLQAWGVGTDEQLAAALKLTQAQHNLETSLAAVRGDFVGASDVIAKTVTAQNLFPNLANAMAFLKNQISSSTGQAKEEAIAQFKDLQQETLSLLDLMVSNSSQKWAQIQSEVSTNAQAAAANASSAFHTMATNIGIAMSSGTISAAKGATLIGQALNDELKSLGAAQIPAVALAGATPQQLISLGNYLNTGAASGGIANNPTPGHKARGGLVDRPTVIMGEEAPTHPEWVIATNPAYRTQNLRYLAAAARDLGVAMFGTGGPYGGATGPGQGSGSTAYKNPIGAGATPERIDQGVDYGGSGVPLYALGSGLITNEGAGTGGWGPWWINLRLAGGEYAGAQVYYAEGVDPMVQTGQSVIAGQRVGTLDGGMEIGFALGSGNSVPSAGSLDGFTGANTTAAGVAMSNLIASLGGPAGIVQGPIAGTWHGAPISAISGGVGGATWTDIKAPTVKGGGTLGKIVQAMLNKAAAAANAYGQKKAAAMLGVGGSFGVPSIAAGSVMKEMYEAATALGFNKIAIAGLIGNANQESSLNPNLDITNVPGNNGVGLFSWNYGTNAQGYQVQLGNVAQQITLAADAIGRAGIVAMNNAGSAAAAAAWFEENFEHAQGGGDLPNREAFASYAYSLGYRKGGKVGYAGSFANGGWATASSPTMAMFGDNGPETALFMPHGAGLNPGPVLDPLRDQGQRKGGELLQLVTAWWYEIQRLAGALDDTNKEWKKTNEQFKDLLAKEKVPGATSLANKVTGLFTRSRRLGLHAHGFDISVGLSTGSERALELANEAIGAAVNKISAAMTAQQATQQSFGSLVSALAGLAPGTTLRSMGIGGALSVQALGFPKSLMHNLIGGGTNSYKAEIAEYNLELGRDEANRKHLVQLYNDAKRIGNKSRENAILALINTVDTGIVGLVGARQQALASELAAPLTAQQANAQAVEGTMNALMALMPGTGLGLSATALRAAGVSPAQAQALMGGGPKAYQALIGQYSGELAKERSMLGPLVDKYRKALEDHNKTLAAAMKKQITAIDGAIITTITDRQTAIINQITAGQAVHGGNAATALGSASSILSALENLPPGTTLASIGINKTLFKTLFAGTGMTYAGVNALAASGLSYFQNLASNQNGVLTAAQIAKAKAGVAHLNTLDLRQIGKDEAQVRYLEGKLPHLRGSAKATVEGTIAGLIGSIEGLRGDIQSNSQSLAQLTKATNASTTATGALTGTVAFTYGSGGQNFLASDNVTNLGVGS